MKSQSVRVTRCTSGTGFNVWHWQKFIGSRNTAEAANELAEEKRHKLARAKLWKEMNKPTDNSRPALGFQRHDPNLPEKHCCTSYGNDGHTRKGWMWLFPAHPFHSAQELRHDRRIVNGIFHEEDKPPGYEPVTIIKATLPPITIDVNASEWVTETNQDQPRGFKLPANHFFGMGSGLDRPDTDQPEKLTHAAADEVNQTAPKIDEPVYQTELI